MLLTEAFTEQELAELSTPEILPCTFDMTIPGWLERIKLWGKIIIHHEDPENHRGKRKVNVNTFLNKISNSELTKMFGKWHLEKHGLTNMSFERDYQGKDGKWYTEKFLVSVKLKRSLR